METFFEHLWLTIIPWLIGMVFGGGLGIFIARSLRPYWETQSTFRSVLLIAPWRTLAVFLLLLTVRSPFMFRYFGLGQATAVAWLSIFSFLLALGMAISLLVTPPETKTPIMRGISFARTLAVVLSPAAIIASDAGAGGAGKLINEGLMTLDQNIFLNGILIVVLVAAILDILLGVVQLLAGDSQNSS